ncbi:MAG: transcription antitermination factor NusB [Synergistaceae bacterium]|nr:transcription antitermination factor NusB [Synergistaceae bacterium]
MADKRKFIGRKFGAIHRSRELAVQFLYSQDVCPSRDVSDSLELFLTLDDVAQDDKPEVKARCRELVRQVRERMDEIDAVLLRVVTGWRPERMVSVDRTILRLMVLEGFLMKSLPVKSAISEARTLAGDFGTDNSARFVNGVMHKAARYFGSESESVEEGEGVNGGS